MQVTRTCGAQLGSWITNGNPQPPTQPRSITLHRASPASYATWAQTRLMSASWMNVGGMFSRHFVTHEPLFPLLASSAPRSRLVPPPGHYAGLGGGDPRFFRLWSFPTPLLSVSSCTMRARITSIIEVHVSGDPRRLLASPTLIPCESEAKLAVEALTYEEVFCLPEGIRLSYRGRKLRHQKVSYAPVYSYFCVPISVSLYTRLRSASRKDPPCDYSEFLSQETELDDDKRTLWFVGVVSRLVLLNTDNVRDATTASTEGSVHHASRRPDDHLYHLSLEKHCSTHYQQRPSTLNWNQPFTTRAKDPSSVLSKDFVIRNQTAPPIF
ncbi:uncharacterized protein CLUP02_10178 [Colletotrichum lupini]|uniref:Uncharacterized protein n=1 Tax=Colletotrichum lupini TaxID=145971 RepID=A0A9Q8WJ43_9PEZI|nr:uncharacterized protein CLUP02_10178 [Colletotrichum lupini]UQC84682.1 hypothetical protein CLUP02_10178 [Colletotrichum lupini]